VNPKELFHADLRPAGVYYCSECRLMYRTGELALAESCCKPKRCTLCDIELEKKSGWTICDACRWAKDDARIQGLWDRATKVDSHEYDDGVYDEDNDKYHDDIDAFLEWLVDEHDEPPSPWPRVFACKPMDFRLDAYQLAEHAFEEAHEDAWDAMAPGAIGELQAVLDAWCERHDPGTVVPDYSRAIEYAHVVDWPKEDPEPATIEVEFGGAPGEVARVETVAGEMTIERTPPEDA
jgi:hypothetical protein